MEMKIALIGKRANDRVLVAFYLQQRHGFKPVRISDGVTKLMRFFYVWAKHQKPPWERRMDIYDALYKLDNRIHIDYLLRRMDTTTMHVVVDDVRYLSELKRLKEEGWIIIRVSSPAKKRHIGKTLLHSDSGTVVLNEYFGNTDLAEYRADYSIYIESREATKRAVDQIILDIEGSNPV
jgi:hypothetical protein